MTEDLSLFGDESQGVSQPRATTPPAPVADWQVDLLRKALDARGLTTMEGRQQAIEIAVGRPIASLRALTHEEGLRVLSRLGAQPARSRAEKSAWDDRDEDTWIDRM